MKEKYPLLIIIKLVFVLLIFGNIYFFEETINVEDFPENIYELNDKSVTVVELEDPTIEYIFIPNDAPSFRSISNENNCSFSINGSFFMGSNLQAEHAGRLNIYGNNLVPVVRNDRQLTHVMKYDSTNRKIEFIKSTDYQQDNSSDLLEFQTGPLVIENGQVTQNYINRSLNGNTQHIRSLIGFDNENKIYLVNAITEMTLNEVADKILNDDRFANKDLNLLNLDGGSSTAIYSRDFSYINFNTNKNLPLVLCFQ